MSDYGYRLAKKAADIDKFFNDLSTLTNPQSALYNLGAGVRPNLLTNAYFANPVNQRGRTSYTEKNAPCIDRWRTLGGDSTVTLTESGLQISGAGPYIWSLAQILQDDVKSAITGETVTISVLHSKGLDSLTIEKALSGEFSQTFTDGVSLWLSTSGQFFIGADDTKILYAAKLERGNIQTLAYQDADGKWKLLPQPDMDYGTQLEKCQRYQLDVNQTNYPATYIGPNVMEFFIPTPVTMRINPSVSIAPEIRTYSEKITDFAISYYKAANGIKVIASKENHGVTNGYLSFLPGAILDANL